MSEKYLIWSNEHRMWWRPASAGYTTNVKDAGRYDREVAIGISKNWRGFWPVDQVPNEMMIAESDVLDCAMLNHPLSQEQYAIDHDGFVGTVQGEYVTREGKRGVVLQQVGTRVVHVYGRQWLKEPKP